MDPQKSVTQYKLDIWQKERGYEQNQIYTIVQSRDGYLWLGTVDGLVRFDGTRFKVYNRNNTEQLKGNAVRALCESRDGSLWIGTSDGGVSRLKNGEFTTYGDETLQGFVSSIIEDREGAIWIGSRHHGLTRFKNRRFTTYKAGDGLPSSEIYILREDKTGNLWIGTSGGLTKRTPDGRFITFNRKAGLECDYIHTLCPKQNGEIWIGTENGLYRMKDRTFTHYGLKEGLPNPKVMCLYEDEDRNLWGGTDGGGLFRINEGRITTLSTGDGMACGYVYDICEDRERNIWIGTLEGGVHRLRDTKFTAYTIKEGLSHNNVNCIVEDRNGDFWIGTDGGLNRLGNGKLYLELSTGKGLLSNHVTSIFEDRTGGLWIGTSDGLHRFKDGNLDTFTSRDGLSHNHVSALVGGKQDDIRVGTLNGLNRLRDGKFSIIAKKEDLVNNTIRTIYEDREGSLWIGPGAGVLYRQKDGKVTRYTPENGWIDSYVESFHEDKEGVLFIGTRGGLSRLENGKFTNCTTQDGLIDNRINYILEDNMGHLWLAGRTGISRVGKKELADFALGKIDKIHPVFYNEEDGMKTQWCNNSGVKSRDGKLWFATSMGVVMIDPANIKTNTIPPPVIIEGLKVDGENVDVRGTGTRVGKLLVLPPGSERLEFSFTGLSFVKPRKVKFKLKLEGYDTDWLDNGNARTTTYTRLSPGEYTLKVIACNGDGVWNEEGASFSFYMEPYFWQTTWFYILVFVFAAFAVITGYRIRVRQLKANEKKLSALVEIKTEALNERTLQLEKAHARLQTSKAVIEEKNRNMMASITYARRIQLASLPTEERLKKVFKDYFIIFKPRDIVSGDFYWFGQSGPRYFIAAVDCTGHGVPGGFLSMMGNMELTEIVNEKPVYDPAPLLMHLHNAIRRVLQQDNGESRSDDGMEVAVCMIDPETAKVTFAGAGNPLYYVCNSEFFEIKGDRKSIGGKQREKKRTFTNHEIDIRSETVIYLTSDGYADQNNSENKKYGSLRLKQFLRANGHLSMKQQKDALLRELANHQGSEDQRDDITIIGIKLKAGLE